MHPRGLRLTKAQMVSLMMSELEDHVLAFGLSAILYLLTGILISNIYDPFLMRPWLYVESLMILIYEVSIMILMFNLGACYYLAQGYDYTQYVREHGVYLVILAHLMMILASLGTIGMGLKKNPLF